METFDKTSFNKAQKSGKICVLHFWSAWCGDCFDIEHLNSFSRKNSDTIVFRVNFEDNEDLTNKYLIKVFPSYLFVRRFEVLDLLIGVQTESSLDRSLDQFKV